MAPACKLPIAAALLSALLGLMPLAQAQQAPASPLVQQLNNGNWLDPKEAESLRDELFYQRAIHAYMTMLPALNTIGMRDGSEEAFGAGYHVLPIWKQRMDSRAQVPTPNADVIYSMNCRAATSCSSPRPTTCCCSSAP